MLNNTWSNGAVHLPLLHLSEAPPLPQLGGELAGESTDLLSLKSKTAAFYQVDNFNFIYFIYFFDFQSDCIQQ